MGREDLHPSRRSGGATERLLGRDRPARRVRHRTRQHRVALVDEAEPVGAASKARSRSGIGSGSGGVRGGLRARTGGGVRGRQEHPRTGVVARERGCVAGADRAGWRAGGPARGTGHRRRPVPGQHGRVRCRRRQPAVVVALERGLLVTAAAVVRGRHPGRTDRGGRIRTWTTRRVRGRGRPPSSALAQGRQRALGSC